MSYERFLHQQLPILCVLTFRTRIRHKYMECINDRYRRILMNQYSELLIVPYKRDLIASRSDRYDYINV